MLAGRAARRLTLRVGTEGARKVARLAVHAFRVLEHAEEEAGFTQQAVLFRTRLEGVAFGERPDRLHVV